MRSSLLLLAVPLFLGVRDVTGAILFRIGTPFTAAEKDSLEGIGLDFQEVDWSTALHVDAVELDSLQAGSLQPNYFDEDEDIASTLLSREGRVYIDIRRGGSHPNSLIGQVLLDEDSSTGYTWAELAAESLNRDIWEKLTLSLGGLFLVREVRFRTEPDKPEQFLQRFTIGVAREADLAGGRVRLPVIKEVSENTEAEVSVFLDPPVTTGYLQLLIYRQTTKQVGIADFELYGGGFVGNASYESEVFELDNIASWGEMRWSGRQDPHARVDIRTRSGSDRHPEIYWESRPEQQDSVRFLQGGGDLEFGEYRRQYGRLSDVLKPVEEKDRVSPDRENWSTWSSPYGFEKSRAGIVSPSPRQYFQIRTDFASTIEGGGKLDYLEFKASVPPAVRGLAGEIFPIETEIGEATPFTYFIKPTIRTGDSGFDAVEISTPSGVVSVDALRMDETDQEEFAWSLFEDGLGFEVVLPRPLQPADSGTLIEIDFRAPVLREVGTLFAGKVFDTTRPHEVRQRILPGEAAAEIESERLSVTTSLSGSLVFSPLVSPNPFTPNGDGINDIVHISYKLLRVTSGVPVAIEIFDLSGRRVKQLYSGIDPLGEYSHSWDGTDDSGGVVPPGLFMYRILADLHSGQEIDTGIVSVAY